MHSVQTTCTGHMCVHKDNPTPCMQHHCKHWCGGQTCCLDICSRGLLRVNYRKNVRVTVSLNTEDSNSNTQQSDNSISVFCITSCCTETETQPATIDWLGYITCLQEHLRLSQRWCIALSGLGRWSQVPTEVYLKWTVLLLEARKRCRPLPRSLPLRQVGATP